MESISIVIPAYNEADNIKRLDNELIKILNKERYVYEILIVNDGSNDDTLVESEKLAKKHHSVRVIKHNRNMGLAAGIITGIKNAKNPLLITLDADLTFHPKEIKKLMKKYRETGADCIIGSQYCKGGEDTLSIKRWVLSRGVNFLYQIFLGSNVTSVSSIFRLYKTQQLKKMNLVSTGFSINSEILINLIKNKARIYEVPVRLTTRIYGESKINNYKEFRNHINILSKLFLSKIHVI